VAALDEAHALRGIGPRHAGEHVGDPGAGGVDEARDAAERGAVIRPRTRVVTAARSGGLWELTVEDTVSSHRPPLRAAVTTRVRGRITAPRSAASRAFSTTSRGVEDSRLVVLNARDAAERGAVIRPRTRVVTAARSGPSNPNIRKRGESRP
jgi:glycerol-3-phosphate dehydrogenase